MLEAEIVLFTRLGAAAVTLFHELIDQAPIVIVPFDEALAEAAFGAYRTYGKGQGHPAQLNIIDCAAYALARARGLPLLFKGDDFARTDAIPALGSAWRGRDTPDPNSEYAGGRDNLPPGRKPSSSQRSPMLI